jgi:DNA repair exonuclease SbcCD ATPase subunit
MRILKFINIIMLFILIFTMTLNGQNNEQQSEELVKLHEEYNRINQRLQEVQELALSDINLAKKSNNFMDNLESKMIDEYPSVEQKLERRDEVVNLYEEAQENGNENRVRELQKEYQELTAELQQHQNKLLEEDSEIREEAAELEEALMAKMVNLDPEVPKLVERMNELSVHIRRTK